MLLSLPTQIGLGLIKDMRACTCSLSEFPGEHLNWARDVHSGLLLVCITQYGNGHDSNLEDFDFSNDYEEHETAFVGSGSDGLGPASFPDCVSWNKPGYNKAHGKARPVRLQSGVTLGEADVKGIEIRTAGLRMEARLKTDNRHAATVAELERNPPKGHGERRKQDAFNTRPIRDSSPKRGHDLSKVFYAIPESTKFRRVVAGIL